MNIEQTEALISGKEFQKLKYFQEKTNVFTVVGQTHTEHWHSAFMSWLFDPNSSLGLGHYPLARLLNLYMIKEENAVITLKDVYSMELDRIKFETEKTFNMQGNKKRSIDVYGESDELIIVIENKVKAKENTNGTAVGQTEDYKAHIDATKKASQKVIYLFITPDPTQRAKDSAYVQITYQELYDYVISKCMEHPQIKEEGHYLLEQYSNNLREPVNGSPMALVNTSLCNEIYEIHGELLDEIFDCVESSDGTSEDLGCLVYNRYRSVFDEIFLSLENKKYGRTPKSVLKRKKFTFTDLYNFGKVSDGMPLTMVYDGITHHAVIRYDEQERECYLLLLDENRQYFKDEAGEIIGYYPTASQAGIDVVNLYRKRRGSDKRINSLSGVVYWKTPDGTTIKSLIEQCI